jgi:hypothetical protein
VRNHIFSKQKTDNMIKYNIMSYAQASRSRRYEYFDLGPCPREEKCTQAGKDEIEHNLLECQVYIDQLTRKHGEPPKDAYFFLMKNIREEFTYYEAAIYYDTNCEIESAYALKVEAELCDYWDDQAKLDLTAADYPTHLLSQQHLRRA